MLTLRLLLNPALPPLHLLSVDRRNLQSVAIALRRHKRALLMSSLNMHRSAGGKIAHDYKAASAVVGKKRVAAIQQLLQV